MIVCRRPFAIYDVDVIGIAALVVLALAACFGVLVPARANAVEHRALSARLAAARSKLEETNGQLRQIGAGIATLESSVAERTRAAPKADAFTPFLQRVATLAEQWDVQIAQVLPQPTRPADGYLFADVRFSGRGTSLNFAGLLDQLARESPYHALEDFAITRAAEPGETRCTLSWTLRLHMLEDDSAGPTGGKP